MSKTIYLPDNYYKKQEITNERYTVRVIIENKEGLYGYIKIYGEDIFGFRDHIESCGGGIEEGETDNDAIIREVREELGCTCEIFTFLGQIIHDFHILKRRTYANYYYVKVIEENLDTSLTELETKLFKDIIWMNLEDIKQILKKDTSDVGKLVHERELLGIQLYEDYLQNNKGENYEYNR